MELKEKIKTRIDRLDPYDLRSVKILMDSLAAKKKLQKPAKSGTNDYYLEVIKLLGTKGLSSHDISIEREERI